MKNVFLVSLLLLGFGCSTEDSAPDSKPQGDPDSALLDGKADRLSNRYTTIVGELEKGVWTNGYIDFPDWFHGHTIRLQAGETMEFRLDAKATGVVRLYGPAVGERNGEPKFRRALVRSWASHHQKDGPGEVSAEFTVEVEESGTYMVVYGPYYQWESKYSLVAECRAGCRQPDECLSNDECATGEACLDNGVRCVRAPCLVNYNTCQAMDDGSCNDDSDCSEGWCRATDHTFTSKECVPFSVEGESCSGFAPPQYINRCEPGLSCVFRPFVADAPGTCRVSVTVKELRTNPAKYAGKRVVVDGYVSAGLAACTKIACPQSDPCCNQCGANQRLADTPGYDRNGLTLTDSNGEFGCSGNECNYQDNCSVEDSLTRIVGTFVKGPTNYTIEVQSTLNLEHL